MCKASLILSWKDVEAVSKTEKQSSEHKVVNLAKFLCTLLDSHIPSDFCARDTFSFVNEITNLCTSDKFMVTFDVESLFTNILLSESIDLAVDYIFSGIPDIKLSKDNLRELFFFLPQPRPTFYSKGTITIR